MKQDFKKKFREILVDTIKTYDYEINEFQQPLSLQDLVKIEQFKGARHACGYLLGRLDTVDRRKKKNENV